MTFPVSFLQESAGNTNIYSKGFRNLIENHLNYLKTSSYTRPLVLDSHIEYKYKGDFNGLLQANGITQDYRWITMRMNGLSSPLDYNGALGVILIPGKTDINSLLSKFLNTTGIQ